MHADIRSIGSQAAGYAWVALRSFVGTLCILTLLGAALAAASYYFLRDQHWACGITAIVVVLIESIALGVVLGSKRALAMVAAHALGSLRLGRFLVRMVLQQMLGVVESQEFGDRGGRIARGLERIPLAQAEELLNRAVRGVLGESAQAGWLRRKMQSRLLAAVQKYTLARFRDDNAKQGGIDLLKVKKELESTIDDVLVRKVRAGVRFWSALIVVGLPLLVAIETWLAVVLLR